EYASGHLPKAKLINVMDASFSGKVDALDKSKTYLVYCRSGSRSRGACEIMASRGFQVFNLDNGIMGWNGPVER
ncbi:MAG TPA: rhodanese-like domain-containing protein, partial [bacterium]|nr:rhodanese-like domain-containing protein [bacterium]